jgi:hypothetical protein
MVCKTCGHTMEAVANGVLWCCWCGSIHLENYYAELPEYSEPKIVHRGLTFCKAAQTILADMLFSPSAPTSGQSPGMQALERCEVAVRECCLAPRDR